jgi:hypothetical protein
MNAAARTSVRAAVAVREDEIVEALAFRDRPCGDDPYLRSAPPDTLPPSR